MESTKDAKANQKYYSASNEVCHAKTNQE